MVARTPKAKGRPTNKDNSPTKANVTPLKKIQGGKVGKPHHGKPPMAKGKRESIKAARMALATGKISTDEQARKHAMDLRTLYVRFKKDMPIGEEQVRKRLDNHPDIKFVRIPRQDQKQTRYAFVEFGSEAECEAAKDTLTKGTNAKDDCYIDFVGVKSKAGAKGQKKKNRAINPNRLFIGGLVEGLDASKLKLLFPKCVDAQIGGKGGRKKSVKSFGFVQFDNPADAKAAFDASQKLTITGKNGSDVHHITVVYAKVSKSTVRDMTAQKTDTKKKKKKAAGGEEAKAEASEQKEEPEEAMEEESKELEDVKEDSKESSEGEEGEDDSKSDDEEEEEVENDADSEQEEDDEEVENDADTDEEEVENDAESSDDDDKS